jgi:hypothetical protein
LKAANVSPLALAHGVANSHFNPSSTAVSFGIGARTPLGMEL